MRPETDQPFDQPALLRPMASSVVWRRRVVDPAAHGSQCCKRALWSVPPVLASRLRAGGESSRLPRWLILRSARLQVGRLQTHHTSGDAAAVISMLLGETR